MILVCLALEGVLVPEIWINFANKTGIEELCLTTRDISDYDVLMNKRLGILEEHKLKLSDIQEVINQMEPMEGALDFIEELRSICQVIILSDTFEEFAAPLMRKLRWPTLFCNNLIIDQQDRVAGYTLRQQDGKRKAVEAFRSTGCDIFAAGDSYNDVTMIQKADHGAFFRAPENIKEEFPNYPAVKEYSELLNLVKKFIKA
jgi:phosphoserine/homoserine phosphotransferase